MLKTKRKNKLELTEENFNRLLPEYLQRASKIYFTPIHIARIAAQWLTEGRRNCVLDIGAGVGKFCITGAINSNDFFCGIEYRPSLAGLANDLISHFKIKNAVVQNGNVTEVDFANFDAFYFYNPFYENLEFAKQLNNEVKLAGELYGNYSTITRNKLEMTKTGTRLVTYHGNNFEIPESFQKIKETEDRFLKLWVRK